MRWVVGVIALLVVVTGAEAQPGTSRSGSPPPKTAPRAPVVPAPVLPGSGSGGAPTRTNPTSEARPASPTATPFSLSGQTVCSPGTVDERPPEERQYWFDGATVGLPGHRCITLH